MCNITPEILPNDDMPGWAVSSVKLLLDLCGNVFLDVVFFECGRRDVNRFLLHLLAHIHILYDGLWWRGADEVRFSGSCGGFCGRRSGRVHFVWDVEAGEMDAI